MCKEQKSGTRPHLDVFFDPLLNRRMAKWNLLVLYINETNCVTENAYLFHSRFEMRR